MYKIKAVEKIKGNGHIIASSNVHEVSSTVASKTYEGPWVFV